MKPDSSDLPTPPAIPVFPAPARRAPWPLLAAIAGVIAALVIVALLLSLFLRGGTTIPLGSAKQTATSAQTTFTAEGTPAPSTTGTIDTSTPTPTGPPAVHIVSMQVTGKSDSPMVVSCPSGELALSGGWTSSVHNIPITFSKRSGNGWQILINTLGAGLTPTSSAYVICLQHVAGVTVTERRASATLGPGHAGSSLARCNPGEIGVGGGGEDSALPMAGLNPYPNHGGFLVAVENQSSLPQTITAYAECLQGSGAKVIDGSAKTIHISPGTSDGVQVTCPVGTLVAGGAFGTFIGNSIYDFSPSDKLTWQAHAKNLGTSTVDFSFNALCVSFS